MITDLIEKYNLGKSDGQTVVFGGDSAGARGAKGPWPLFNLY